MKKVILSDDIKEHIARIITGFELKGIDGGSCVARAILAHEVLLACGLPSRIVRGAMLLRAGLHPERDVLIYAGPHNHGCVHKGIMLGHVWNEWQNDLLDFSTMDWKQASSTENMVTFGTHSDCLGSIQWMGEPVPFIWTEAKKLTRSWRKEGYPTKVGEAWYGPWKGQQPPFPSEIGEIIREQKDKIHNYVDEFGLVERIAIYNNPNLATLDLT